MSVHWSGLEELRAELRNLPAELAGEASHIVQAEANGAAVAVRSEYGRHVVTGHLQNSVSVNPKALGPFGVAIEVKANDPIAWLFDHGSVARHYITAGRGASHATGVMWGRTRPTHVFARTMARARRSMYAQLSDLLVRHGLRVSGEP